jgi:hypothetical protein
LYVDAPSSVARDLAIIGLTVRGALDRPAALAGVGRIAASIGAGRQLQEIIARQAPLPAAPPPGASDIVQSRVVVA